MKKTLIALIVIVLIGLGIYFWAKTPAPAPQNQTPEPQQTQEATTTVQMEDQNAPETVIGKSVKGNDIMSYHFGTGSDEIVFILGIHGGYSWNTAFLGYKMVDYFKESLTDIPANVKLTIIPVLNPDGLKETVGSAGRFELASVPSKTSDTISGRFNGNTVDLNRNFDCDWEASGVWQSKTVSGGSAPFSEPETMAIKDYVTTHNPVAVVTWYSSAGGVYASSCHNGVSENTKTILKKFSDASKYKAYNDFNFYEITGDMVNWLAKINVPAISVVLTNHTSIEWDKNLAGIKALLTYYAK